MSCYCDYDPAAFYIATIRTARRPYRCEDCGGRILPGDKYEHVSAKWDWIQTFRTCERCRDIRQWVQNNVPCFCYAHAGLEETATEAIDDACWRAPAETVGLRFGFRRRIVERDKFNAARARAAAA